MPQNLLLNLNSFSFPDVPNIVANGVDNIGVFIFNENNNYCFGLVNHVEANKVPLDSIANTSLSTDDDVIQYDPLPNSENTLINKKDFEAKNVNRKTCVDLSELVSGVTGFRRDFKEKGIVPTKSDVVKMQLPDKAFDGLPFYNYTYCGSGSTAAGSLSISQYRYNICKINENGKTRAVADVVSQITVASNPSAYVYVSNYNTRMHANITNMNVIGQSYIDSNTSSSYTLSGGITIGSNGQVTQGSIGASTTNSYNTNSQNITNDFYAQRVKNWNCDPVVNTYGASWCIEPCIRVINNDAVAYQSGAFTSFQGGWFANSSSLGVPIPVFEVGGFWQQ